MNIFRDFIFYTRGQRRGILLLAVALMAVLLGGWWGRRNAHSSDHRVLANADSLAETYRTFVESVKRTDSIRQQACAPRKKATTRPTLRPFDPNVADSAQLSQLGLPGWMARNVVRYRQKGGVFRKPEDFRRIYGMTDERFATLLPYIRITRQDTIAKDRTAVHTQATKSDKDSTQTSRPSLYPHTSKYPAGTVIALNRADTAELKRIPGIGSVIARMIVDYRTRLGGFYSVSQLKDIRLRDDLLEPWFSIDTTAIRRVNLNRGGTASLRRHPYINFYQARAIVEWRREHGPLKDLTPFERHPDFTKEDLEKLGHYVCFE